MRSENIIPLITILGFVLQFIGIYKGISSTKRLRDLFGEWSKKLFELGHRKNSDVVQNTAVMNLEAQRPFVSASLVGGAPPNVTIEELTKWTEANISGIGEQIASVREELNKLDRRKTLEMQNELSERDAAVNRLGNDFQNSVAKTDNAEYYLFFGTVLLLAAELGKW